jgi:asparagine synthase (glutamine-hydrolysing)
MCGITGFLMQDALLERRAILRKMTETLVHRGPDDEGLYTGADAALGVRRLSIIDVAGGHQPVANEDATVWAAHNGEIYNFRELRERLERNGHHFKSGCDSEVIVHAYEDDGVDCVARLDGMFAIAVWDVRARRLFLARDRMGEKPLYYYAGPGIFVFGSELRALLAHPAVPAELSLASLARYLAFEYVPAPHSMLAGISKLPPGHILTVTPGGLPRVTSYWRPSFRTITGVTEAEWRERLLGQLERSVRSRLVADVPVGMFLSGGVDSSAIVALAARMSGQPPFRTFSLGFTEATYDERSFARVVAERFGTVHEEVLFSAADALALVETLGHLLDEPLVDPSFLPLISLSRQARRHVSVALSGDGGDELFCGYPTFQAEATAAWLRRLPGWMRRAAVRVVDALPPSPRYGSVGFLLTQFLRGLPHPRAIRTQLLLGGLTAAERAALLAPGVRAGGGDLEPYDALARAIADGPARTPLDELIYQHYISYLPDQNLVATDRASMRCGLEVRAPFLDHALVELAGEMPGDLKLRRMTTKYLLKRSLRGLVPAAILARRKQGFGVPIGAWLRGPLRAPLEEALSPQRVARVGLFQRGAVGRLVRDHVDGRADHRKILWSLFVFDRWREHYLPRAQWT